MNNVIISKQKDDYNYELKKLKEIHRTPFNNSVKVEMNSSSSESCKHIFKKKLYKTPFDIRKVNLMKKKNNQSYQNINKLLNSYMSINDLSKDYNNDNVSFINTNNQFMITGIKYDQGNNNKKKHHKHLGKSFSMGNLHQTNILPII